MGEVETAVREIVTRITKVSPERIELDTDLKAELNVDSLQGLQIVAALENQFGVRLPDEELDNYTTVRLITDTVTRLRV
jgi:acyl carrier protein